MIRGVRLRLALPLAIAVFTVASACTSGRHRRAPAAPTLVTAIGGDATITVSWADVPGADNYILYFARQSGVGKTTYSTLLDGGRNSGATSPVNFTQAHNGETWFFVVTAVSASGYESDDSQEVYASATPWPQAIVIDSANGDALTGSLAVDPSGNIFAVWSRQHPNRYTIQSARFAIATDTWSNPATLDSDAGFSYSPRVDVDANGKAVAIWRQGQGSDDAIWTNTWISGWGAPQRVPEITTGAARNPDIAAANAGTFLIAFAQFDGVSENVYGGNFAGSFGPVTVLDTGAPDADFPRVAGDDAGNGTAVFTQRGAVWTADYAAGWQAPTILSTTTTGAASPAIAMNGAGKTIAAWREPNPAGFDLWAATRSGGAWSAPVRLEEQAGTVGAPAVAIGLNGDGVVVFAQRVGLHDVLQADRFIAGAWQGAARIDGDDSGDVKEIAIAVSNSSQAIALWSQDVVGPGGTSKNIYSNRYSVVDSAWSTAVIASPFGLNSNPSVVIGSSGIATGVWTWLEPGGTAVLSNRLPLP